MAWMPMGKVQPSRAAPTPLSEIHPMFDHVPDAGAHPTPGKRPPNLRTALVADLFCGAGGSSTGARRALERRGYRMELVAVNH